MLRAVAAVPEVEYLVVGAELLEHFAAVSFPAVGDRVAEEDDVELPCLVLRELAAAVGHAVEVLRRAAGNRLRGARHVPAIRRQDALQHRHQRARPDAAARVVRVKEVGAELLAEHAVQVEQPVAEVANHHVVPSVELPERCVHHVVAFPERVVRTLPARKDRMQHDRRLRLALADALDHLADA